MSSLVLELQQDALDRNVRASDLLRKALVVAKKLKLEDFEAWVSKELSGYLPDDAYPNYRTVTGEVKAWNPYHGWVPVYCEDSEEAELMSKRICSQSVAEFESIIEKGGQEKGLLMMRYPKRVELQILESILPLTQPILQVQHSSVMRILDAVRTTVLNWSLKLEEDGVRGEGLSFSAEEKKIVSGASYNITNFFGPVGQSQIQQQTADSVQTAIKSDFDFEKVRAFIESVTKSLAELDIDPVTSDELKAEVKTIESQLSSPKPKAGIIKESLQSVRHILEGATGGVAAQGLLHLLRGLLGG